MINLINILIFVSIPFVYLCNIYLVKQLTIYFNYDQRSELVILFSIIPLLYEVLFILICYTIIQLKNALHQNKIDHIVWIIFFGIGN